MIGAGIIDVVAAAPHKVLMSFPPSWRIEMRFKLGWQTTIGCAGMVLIAGLAIPAAPVQAGDPFGGGLIGGALNQLNRAARGINPHGGGGHRSHSRERGEEDSASRSQTSAANPDNQQDAKNYAMALAEWQERERTARLERERNVDAAVSEFIGTLEEWHHRLRANNNANVRVSSGLNINQVTAGEVKKAIEDAYSAARLGDFERHAGEMWTRDRLMVRILRRAEAQLDPYFRGVGVKGTSMEDLKQLFESAAKHVHARALETAEIIGVSYSFDRFIQTIYENSDRADENLWTLGADGQYERLVSTAINSVPRKRFILDDKAQIGDSLGLTRQFQYRFRARRAVYDCLSAHYLDMVNGSADGHAVIPASVQTNATGKAKPEPGAHAGQPTQAPRMAKLPGRDLLSTLGAGEVDGAWMRANAFVKEECLGPVKEIAEASNNDQIKPIPARWNLAPQEGGSPSRINAGLKPKAQ
jgi:hypothetical protein